MSILSPTDRAVLWRMVVTSGPDERESSRRILASAILESAGRRLDLYGGYEDEIIETVQVLDASSLLGRDDLREAFEEADEDEERAQAFAALLATHLSASAGMERLGVDTRLKAMRLAARWQRHLADRARERPEWLTAAQVAARYDVTPQAVYKWISTGRIGAEQTPGGSWRIPSEQFAHRQLRPGASTDLKTKLLRHAGGAPAVSEEALANEIVGRRRT